MTGKELQKHRRNLFQGREVLEDRERKKGFEVWVFENVGSVLAFRGSGEHSGSYRIACPLAGPLQPSLECFTSTSSLCAWRKGWFHSLHRAGYSVR